ncbi:hypothetical protein ABZ341_35930 [Streptomyces sp. NPDC006173]|uniref:hypothetical protein n=1 Tax=Streptomyces sp. NPDC006173 TaxID=3155349 RepID=UPI0033D8C887
MSTTVIVIIAVVVVLLVCAVAAWVATSRRRKLRERFGPEYERAVETKDGRRDAERELREREERHDALDLRPLSEAVRDRYTQDWTKVQETFVDRPEDAVHAADQLVSSLMSDRGYPTEGYEQQLKDLSVEHGRTLEHYRVAHEINGRSSSHQATTEELRGAMVHYRALFDELLHDGDRPRGSQT